MNTQEILIEARALIERPARWTQLAFARDAAGVKVPVTSPNAVQWCAAGAVACVAHTYGRMSCAEPLSFLHAAAERISTDTGLCFRSAMSLNDSGCHSDVLQMFNLAIEKAAA